MKEKSFEEIIKPVMRYLAENYHPHTTIIVTSTDAEIVEGIKALHTEDFLVD